MAILIIIEHHGQQLNPNIFNILTAAQQLQKSSPDNPEINLFIAGNNTADIITKLKNFGCCSKIYAVSANNYEHALAEEYQNILTKLISEQNFSYILFPANTFGKNIAPRIAAKLNINPVTDISKIISSDTFVRPIYAGNALATIQNTDPIKILTIRATAFAKYKINNNSDNTKIIKLTPLDPFEKTKFINEELSKQERPELVNAKIVVSGGRALQSKENFKLIEQLADSLGAAIGASRAAVDAGYLPNDYQIGQTGKVIAPELYLGIGISGAIQHVAGMKDSKIIVAINKDPNATLMKIADYALVGDLFTIIPELIAEINKIKSQN